jgi:hypothetical protein
MIQKLMPSFVTSSATAAALLFTVLAFLYNMVERLRENNHEAERLYLETRTKLQLNLMNRLKNANCSGTTKGNAGTRGRVDYEWTTDKYFPVTQQQAYPDLLKDMLLSLSRPFLRIVFNDSIDLHDVLDLEDDNVIDRLIVKSLTKDCHIEFRSIFVQNPHSTLGVSFTQFIFLTQLPVIMRSIIKFMRVISISIVVFIGALFCFVLSFSATALVIGGVIAYFSGWATVIYGVKIILSIIPIVRRRERLVESPLEIGLPL